MRPSEEQLRRQRLIDEERYGMFKKGLEAKTDEELVERFNREVGNPGWVRARAIFFDALRHEFLERGWDFSAIGGPKGFSVALKVRLEGKRLVPVPDSNERGIGGSVHFAD